MLNIKNKSKLTIIVFVVLIILSIGGGAYSFQKMHTNNKPLPAPSTARSDPNLNPPTKEDQQRADKNKQDIINSTAVDTKPAVNGKTAVKPTITYAATYGDSVEVGAYVSGIFEDNGSCTATFSNGNTRLEKQVSAVKGSSVVNCPAMSLPSSSFSPKGTWSVVVSYNSTAAVGESAPRQLEVK